MRRACVLLTVALATGVAVPARAATPAATLAGRTEIVAGSGSTRMAVRLSRPVKFPPGYTDVKFVTVSGTADMALAYLVPRQRPLLKEPAVFGRLGREVGRTTIAGFPDGASRLAAGTYDLVVVHTPGTAKITLTFPGLSGRTTLRPATRSSAVLKPLPVAPAPDGTYLPAASSGGVPAALGGNGFIHVASAMRGSAGGATRILSCLKTPDDVVPEPVAFAPECPGVHAVASVLVAGTFRYFTTTFLNWDRGSYAAGFAYEGTVVPTAVGGLAAFVPLP
jgi:hypothetical protein